MQVYDLTINRIVSKKGSAEKRSRLLHSSLYERSVDCERRMGSSLFDSLVSFLRRSDADAGTTAFCGLCENWDMSKRRRNDVLITVCAC